MTLRRTASSPGVSSVMALRRSPRDSVMRMATSGPVKVDR